MLLQNFGSRNTFTVLLCAAFLRLPKVPVSIKTHELSFERIVISWRNRFRSSELIGETPRRNCRQIKPVRRINACECKLSEIAQLLNERMDCRHSVEFRPLPWRRIVA